MVDVAIIDAFLKHLYDKGNMGACLSDVLSVDKLQQERVETTLIGKSLVVEQKSYVAGKKRLKISDIGIEIIQNHDGSFQKWVDAKNEVNQLKTITIHAENVQYTEGSVHGNQNQSSITKNAAKDETSTIREIGIGLLVSIVGGLVIWYLTTQVF